MFLFRWLLRVNPPANEAAPSNEDPPSKEAAPSLPANAVRYPRHASDVYHVTFLLRQLLIPDLVPSILDAAEYWPRVLGAETDDSRSIWEQNAGQSYLSAAPPRDIAPRGIRRVILSVTSRDQGYSWDRVWHGTYEHSWTWFNGVVYELDAQGAVTVCVDIKRIITNVHASEDWKTHTVTWACDAEDEKVREAISQVQAGKNVAITAWAKFGAWENRMLNARIEFDVACVTRG